MRFSLILAVVLLASTAHADMLEPADTKAGYIARLLINETPFPGEHGWVSETDTKAAMLAILWVLHSRIDHVPPGYRQEHIAATRSRDIIDVITAGGVRGQCDGFYRDDAGRFVAVPRVHERIDHLVEIAGRGEPGRFARLLVYAQDLARGYGDAGPDGADRYLELRFVNDVEVTGRAYSWMTDMDMFSPGGDFIRIPDQKSGAAGGNRFFTLRKRK